MYVCVNIYIYIHIALLLRQPPNLSLSKTKHVNKHLTPREPLKNHCSFFYNQIQGGLGCDTYSPLEYQDIGYDTWVPGHVLIPPLSTLSTILILVCVYIYIYVIYIYIYMYLFIHTYCGLGHLLPPWRPTRARRRG